MKLLFAIVAICMVPRFTAAAPVAVEIASVESLRALGITCRWLQLQTPSASVEIDVTVDEGRAPGKYEGAECIVLKDRIPADGLVVADSASADSGAVARRNKSTKLHPVFLVLGREVPKAYLAFQFSIHGDSAGTIARRYLLSVSAVREGPAAQVPEPTTTAIPPSASLFAHSAEDRSASAKAAADQAQPLVSLIAEDNGAIVGHIMFSPVSLSGHPALRIMGLAPMAVAPEHQRKGIGSALVRAGLEQCRQLGFGAVVVLGHPAYYPRFGFSSAARFGIGCEYEVPEDVFMVLELHAGFLSGASGQIKYHAAFNNV